MRQLIDPAQITDYHAHVYYRPETRAAAEALRDELETRFAVRLGRWHDTLVGPHTRSMYQVAFAPAVFADLVPWLMLNRVRSTARILRKPHPQGTTHAKDVLTVTTSGLRLLARLISNVNDRAEWRDRGMLLKAFEDNCDSVGSDGPHVCLACSLVHCGSLHIGIVASHTPQLPPVAVMQRFTTLCVTENPIARQHPPRQRT